MLVDKSPRKPSAVFVQIAPGQQYGPLNRTQNRGDIAGVKNACENAKDEGHPHKKSGLKQREKDAKIEQNTAQRQPVAPVQQMGDINAAVFFH